MSVTAKHLERGAGERYRVFGGDEITFKITGEETGGALLLIETVTPPQSGPPPHVHHREDELFYVVDGEFEFWLEGNSFRAGPGAVVAAPRDKPHWFRNVTDRPGKMLIACQPAGFEHFIREFAQIDPDARPDYPRMAEIGAKYGIEFAPPP